MYLQPSMTISTFPTKQRQQYSLKQLMFQNILRSMCKAWSTVMRYYYNLRLSIFFQDLERHVVVFEQVICHRVADPRRFLRWPQNQQLITSVLTNRNSINRLLIQVENASHHCHIINILEQIQCIQLHSKHTMNGIWFFLCKL